MPSQNNLVSVLLLRDMVTKEGLLSLYKFRVWLSKDIIKRIVSIPPLIPQQGLIESIGLAPQQDLFLLKVHIGHFERICEI